MNREQFSKILHEGTLLPVSLVVVIVGASFWLSSTYSKIAQAEARVEKVEIQLGRALDDLHGMKVSLSVIAENMRQMNETVKEIKNERKRN